MTKSETISASSSSYSSFNTPMFGISKLTVSLSYGCKCASCLFSFKTEPTKKED